MNQMYDFIGIGIGPYNLSLAALTEDIHDLQAIFFDQTPKMEWHPGMLIEGTDLQVPFLADLVTFADPTNRFSYLNYLYQQRRLYQFFFFHKMEVPRKEYNDYLQWVTNQLDGLHFGKKVIDVTDQGDHYNVFVRNIEMDTVEIYHSRHIVMATGEEPLTFDNMAEFPNEDVLHTSRYLYEKEALMKANHITIIGSGQSAAEIFYDLLEERKNQSFHLAWLTRSEGIFQLEAAKLGQEFFSPNYVEYFHSLPLQARKQALQTLSPLRKGIDYSTLNGIYQLLYHYSIGGKDPNVTIQPLTEVIDGYKRNDGYGLRCHQWQSEQIFDFHTEKIILATGYRPHIPDWFMKRFKDKIMWEDNDDLLISKQYALSFKDQRTHRFYIVTNLENSHGTAATNLGLAVQRNMEIINDLLGEEYFTTDGSYIFQQFRPSQS